MLGDLQWLAQSHQFTPEAAPPALTTPKEMELARVFRKHTTMADGVLGGGPVGPRSSASPLCACLRGGRGSRKACQGTRSTQRGCCWSRTSAPARSAHPPSHSCRPNPRGEPPLLRLLSLGSFHTSQASGSYEHHINTMDS